MRPQNPSLGPCPLCHEYNLRPAPRQLSKWGEEEKPPLPFIPPSPHHYTALCTYFCLPLFFQTSIFESPSFFLTFLLPFILYGFLTTAALGTIFFCLLEVSFWSLGWLFILNPQLKACLFLPLNYYRFVFFYLLNCLCILMAQTCETLFMSTCQYKMNKGTDGFNWDVHAIANIFTVYVYFVYL